MSDPIWNWDWSAGDIIFIILSVTVVSIIVIGIYFVIRHHYSKEYTAKREKEIEDAERGEKNTVNEAENSNAVNFASE